MFILCIATHDACNVYYTDVCAFDIAYFTILDSINGRKELIFIVCVCLCVQKIKCESDAKRYVVFSWRCKLEKPINRQKPSHVFLMIHE